MSEIEEGTALRLNFGKLASIAAGGEQVVPVVLQDAETSEVLFIAYANRAALEETLASGRAVLWSTSRQELWRKGETSGDVLDLVEVRVNCEQNSLLYRVSRRTGACCHTRDAAGRHRGSCYYRRLESASALRFV
jgi:phosphoribosyl-AMP cyclohydrolase